MQFVEILVLALALAMDATAVSLSCGLAATRVRWRDAALVALFFGGFQAGMPVIGWAAGELLAGTIAQWADWVAFGLLAVVGAKMIYEGVTHDDEKPKPDPFRLRNLLVLAVATSIDALAVGITLPLLGANILIAVVVIGVVTAALSFVAVHVGRRVGHHLGSKLDVAGGVVLLGLAVKILVDHFAG